MQKEQKKWYGGAKGWGGNLKKPSNTDAKLKKKRHRKERFHKSLHLFPTVATTISPFPPKTNMPRNLSLLPC
ncbi:hypothetical protein Peur_004224 [Populus x canadensis]